MVAGCCPTVAGAIVVGGCLAVVAVAVAGGCPAVAGTAVAGDCPVKVSAAVACSCPAVSGAAVMGGHPAIADSFNNANIVESLQSHMILTMSHWSSGLTCLLPAARVTGSDPLGGTYVKPGFSC